MVKSAPPKRVNPPVSTTNARLRAVLLSWYDRARRDLPWRAPAGARQDLYRVWLSEVMLQQTTVGAVAPYYEKFLALFPDVAALAAAPREAVLGAWAGLGYYSRARNLHAAAQALASDGFPTDEAGWRALPGVGAYTAAAVAAIGLGLPANAVDGNVERVLARLYALETPLPAAKPALKRLAEDFVAADRPGDWIQALMDLGATVCSPRAPACAPCPWRGECAAHATGAPEDYPRRTPKRPRPRRCGAAFRLHRGPALWLVRRPETGLLGAMPGLPTTEWREETWPEAEALVHAPAPARWTRLGAVRHVFTHFTLELDVYAARARASPAAEGWWASAGEAGALPTLFAKALRLPCA